MGHPPGVAGAADNHRPGLRMAAPASGAASRPRRPRPRTPSGAGPACARQCSLPRPLRARQPGAGRAFARIDVTLIFASLSLYRIGFWLLFALPLWAMLRPRVLRFEARHESAEAMHIPGVSAASVMLSLLAFNLIFAMQNGMDVAFLWSGAGLPAGMTLA